MKRKATYLPAITFTALTAGLLAAGGSAAHAAHVYAGAIDTNGVPRLQAGDALSFVNNATGAIVTGPGLGIQPLTLVTAGPQSGLFFTNNISYTALAGTNRNWTGTGIDTTGAYRAKSSFGALPGSFIELRIANVTGPAGAQFSLWDDEVSAASPAITFTIGTGVTFGSGVFNLTDPALIIGDGTTVLPANPDAGVPYQFANYAPSPDGLPSGFSWNDADGAGPGTAATDPYGHVHGRSMTFNAPGEYTVSYILHDRSGQQADSQPFVVSYSSIPEPASLCLLAAAAATLGFARSRNRRA